ncbi:protein JINGUBANG-like [Diospyros lotus]|uniref:protein JINGUBANG-like n=1 Tax=Diospyros lotus TaxID=55363 RepID=UPI00224E622A|nr:protein JINGUBANG-like [Diospyros lotus]
MASLDCPNSPPGPSFAIRGPQTDGFFRSISTKEAASNFSDFPCTSPSRLSSPSFSPASGLHTSQPSSPGRLLSPKLSADNDLQASHRCISSVLKKDGQILSIAAANGLVYTGSESNILRVWKLPEFTECGQLKTKACMALAIELSNDKVYAAYADCKIRVWRRTWEGVAKHVRLATIPRTGSYVRSYITGKDKLTKHMGPISSLAINVSDGILYSASLDKTVRVWQISDHKCIESIQAHSEPINAVAVADDGVLYTASDDATVRVWRRNFCSGDRPHSLTVTLPAKSSPVKALTLTVDGGILYGGCTDGYIHYWLKGWFSGQLQYGGSLQGHTHAVMCLASMADYVVSGSADSTGRVWVREQDGQHSCVAVLQGHRGPIRSVAAFPGRLPEEAEEGCTVCTGSLDGVLKVWRVTCGRNSDRSSAQKDSFEYFELN